jgi:signal transduction histidine kinase
MHMRDDELSAQDRERMRAERDALKAELAQRVEQVETLSRELAETNSGVVALYAELDDKAEQLREASELKSRFLSYMSHEFRTPLGSIRSLTRILLDRLDGPLTPEQEKQIGFIQTSAQELSEMVNDLLDLAKIEAGRISISPAWFELVDLFAALRGMFKPILRSPQVALVFEEPVNLPRAFSDAKKIGQILRNFISNGLKFTRRGEVRVSAESHDPGWVKFAVADTGIGIGREHLGALFRDFVQVDSRIQRRVQGVGLGLALSKRIAELLGGSVGVESELGQGSIFYATLPIHFTPSDSPQTVSETARGARLKDV